MIPSAYAFSTVAHPPLTEMISNRPGTTSVADTISCTGMAGVSCFRNARCPGLIFGKYVIVNSVASALACRTITVVRVTAGLGVFTSERTYRCRMRPPLGVPTLVPLGVEIVANHSVSFTPDYVVSWSFLHRAQLFLMGQKEGDAIASPCFTPGFLLRSAGSRNR